ncbi:MAG: sulfite exporter TauE/SafE family protein [Phycisphaerales bacterium]|nr:MAG: sulfite exporter TauE/SafE family protein [Phycisphaerales bacterium]
METFQTIVLPIIFIATLTRSTFGFGDAMVGMPLLVMAIPLDVATPLVGLMGITASATILIRHWRDVHIKSVWPLIVYTLVGIPIGVWLLKDVYENVMKTILALVIISFSLYRLFKPKLFTLASDKLACIFGLASGILGGAYNTNGPPVVIYGTLRRWNPEKFRATLQGYFFPTGALIATGHCIGGLWTKPVLVNYAFSFPVLLVAIFLGGRINRKIPKARFDNYIYGFLVILGVCLLMETVRSVL